MLTWSAPPAWGSGTVSDYIVEFSTNFGASWTVFADGVSTATAATVTGLVNGAVHWFRVKAVNSAGTGAASNTANATPFAPVVPGAPRSLVATAGTQRVTLTWIAPLTDGGAAITDYVIDVSTNLGSTWVRAADAVSTATSALISPLSPGVTHTFRVAAVNSVGTGTFSGSVSAIPWAPNAPSVPRSLGASSQLNALYVSWTAPSSDGGAAIDAYLVDWSVDGGTTWQGLVTLSSGTRWTTLSPLTGGTAHVVRVRATNGFGTSPAATVSATPTAPSVPSVPRSLWVNAGYNSASLYWMRPSSNGGSAVTGYRIEWSTDAGATWPNSTVVASTQTSTRIDSLVGGQWHHFRVVAINAIGASAPTAPFAVTVLAVTAPGTPRNFGGFLSGTSAYLSWSTPSSNGGAAITGYEVSQSTDSGATWSIAATVVAPVRSARIDSLVGGTTYLFRVVARNAVGLSAPSTTVTLQPRITGTPNPPSNVV
ncbi:MAG: fibronectin type III domain-containing protein, partial [Actinomycetota bacterium]